MPSSTLIMLLSASTAFAAMAPSYAAPAPPAYTTAAATSDCAKTCVEKFRACQTAPLANQSLCASNLAECVGYNPYEGGFVTPTACSSKTASATATATASVPAPPAYTTAAATSDCAKTCVEKFRACQTAPLANQSLCASNLAECVGYNPYEGGFVTPTACSSKTASATATAPASTTSASQQSPSDCAKTCVEKFRACQTAPLANQSLCASNLAECVNYNPYEGGFVTPTACSASSASKTAPAYTTSTATTDSCAADCLTKYRTCQTAPYSNRASCASDFSSCLGYLPFESGSLVEPTACSKTAAKPTGASTVNGTMPAGTVSATYSAPAQYTGAAALFGSSLMAVGAGVAALVI